MLSWAVLFLSFSMLKNRKTEKGLKFLIICDNLKERCYMNKDTSKHY